MTIAIRDVADQDHRHGHRFVISRAALTEFGPVHVQAPHTGGEFMIRDAAILTPLLVQRRRPDRAGSLPQMTTTRFFEWLPSAKKLIRSTAMRTIGILAALVVAAVAVYFGEHFKAAGYLTFHGALPEAGQPAPVSITHLVIDGLTLLFGLVLGNMSARLHALRGKGVKKVVMAEQLRGMIQSTDFWIALCAAPVVFAVIVGMIGSMTLLASAVFSFQNGFFWQSIMPSKPAHG